MPYLVDTNVLVRMCDRSSSEYGRCHEVVGNLIRRGEACHTCAQTLIEFWAVATRPRDVNGLGLSPSEAFTNLTDFQQSMPCLPEPSDIARRWQALVVEHEVRGRKAHDARLVAFMDAQQLPRILTLNKADFERFAHVCAVSPLDIE